MIDSVLLYGDYSPGQLASSFQRSFSAQASRFISFDSRIFEAQLQPWLRNRLLHRLTIRSLNWRRLGSRVANRFLQTYVEEQAPVLMFILKGDFIMPETIQAIKKQGTTVFLFHPDNPFPPFANHRPETLETARVVSSYFIWSRSVQERLREAGVQDVVYLPFAWDPLAIPYGASESDTGQDLIFIGGWDRERETWLEPLAKEFDLAIWGPDYWQNRARSRAIKQAWRGRSAVGREFSQLSNRAKISLNIIRRHNMPDGTNMRTFELPGAGVFSLSLRTAGAVEIFPEGQAGAYFSTPEELWAKVNDLLPQSQLREEMSDAAHKIVQTQTYKERVEAIVTHYISQHH